ncbi:MAG: alternative ribosome rescue aminoacyl-tRNA hydrolase ArfB [Phycisphaerae bacterium]
MVESLKRRLGFEQLSFTYTRCPGPGGQNVNKVNTRVALLFDVEGSDALNAREKDRIRARLGTRISRGGVMRVVSMRHRTQSANRRAAIQRFYELLAWALHQKKMRVPAVVPARVRRHRLAEKRRRGKQKRLRSQPSDEGFDA